MRATITFTCSPSHSVTWKNRGTHARRKLLIKLMSRMSVASHPCPPHTHTDYVILQSSPITILSSNHRTAFCLSSFMKWHYFQSRSLSPGWRPWLSSLSLRQKQTSSASRKGTSSRWVLHFFLRIVKLGKVLHDCKVVRLCLQVTEMEDDSGWFTAEIQGKRGYIPQNYISLLPYP